MQELSFETREAFRRWLEANHNSADGLWLVYYKKHTGLPTVRYEEAVEEALCFGWIDSKIQAVDELRYKQVFTPRRAGSKWSGLNKKRAEKMMATGRMTAAGLAAIEAAKEKGSWQKADNSRIQPEMPKTLETALKQQPQAWEQFMNMAPSYQKNYIAWVLAAKRDETRLRRIEQVVTNALKNKKPGML